MISSMSCRIYLPLTCLHTTVLKAKSLAVLPVLVVHCAHIQYAYNTIDDTIDCMAPLIVIIINSMRLSSLHAVPLVIMSIMSYV